MHILTQLRTQLCEDIALINYLYNLHVAPDSQVHMKTASQKMHF